MAIKIRGTVVINDSRKLTNIANGSGELSLSSDTLTLKIGGTTQDTQSLQSLTVDQSLKLTTARTITLSGDVSGSTTFDGSANKTISVTVSNDSHTHDGRYYTESEINTKLANSSNWNTAYTDRKKWDGGSSSLNATTGRSSLGITGNSNTTHYHDGRYYTKDGSDSLYNPDITIGVYEWGNYFNFGGSHAGTGSTTQTLMSAGCKAAMLNGFGHFMYSGNSGECAAKCYCSGAVGKVDIYESGNANCSGSCTFLKW